MRGKISKSEFRGEFTLIFTLTFTLTFSLTFTLTFSLTSTLHLQIDEASSRSIERHFCVRIASANSTCVVSRR